MLTGEKKKVIFPVVEEWYSQVVITFQLVFKPLPLVLG